VLENIIWFAIGMIVSQLFKYVMSLGLSVIILNQTQESCAALFTLSSLGLQRVLELKYIEMADSERSEKNIMAQRHIDQINVESIKSSIMRNYINSFPSSYKHTMQYSTWKEMENFVYNKTNKGVSE
jgi:hypothetical protein|tara:strand:- start:9062 stop:9442 length:381 start_codon:yes stop_codon:yes gene_type:complete